MKKTRRRYDRDFKISILAELESGKLLAQIAREHGISSSLPPRWRKEFAMNPETAFRGNGRNCKENARTSEKGSIVERFNADNVDLIGKNKKNGGQIFEIIQGALSHDPQLSIRKACRLHRASRSGYYAWMKRPKTASSAIGLNHDLKEQIQEIALKFPEYGYRRVTTELRNRGYMVNHKRVLRIMREEMCSTFNH